MKQYIHQLSVWPKFVWNYERIAAMLASVRNRQGHLIGRMQGLGFALRSEAELEAITAEVLKSSEIEGEILDRGQVRSSIARRLGMEIAGLVPSDRNVDGVVEMMMDAAQNFRKPLTKDRLFGWLASLFPSGRSGMRKIKTGALRDDSHGPMQVVSGAIGREKVHFEAPEASRLKVEIKHFLKWFNVSGRSSGSKESGIDPVLKAGIAHLWFVTLHPFEDGNGRIARAITDMQLARSDKCPQRFYSMSSSIRRERSSYYEALEEAQKSAHVHRYADGTGIDVTAWLEWFLGCLDRALNSTDSILAGVFRKSRFWEKHSADTMNERQRMIVNKLLDGFEGKLTSSKWAKVAKCSQDTALRDITELVNKEILVRESAGGRSTSYLLA